jgi:hypothetical protein
MSGSNTTWTFFIFCAWLSAIGPACSAEPSGVVFEKNVLPILKAKCFSCHGNEKVEANLRLDSRERVLQGGESGKVIVPGDVETSYLFELIEAGEMPPEGETPLTKEEVAEIRGWIEMGARFEGGATVDQVHFHEVQPILMLRCVACHGAQLKEAELDLRSDASILKGGKSGPALVAGKPKESLLIQRIHAGEMPPKRRLVESSSKPIEANEVARLERWIQQGAQPPELRPVVERSRDQAGNQGPISRDDPHWAFHPPRKATVPQTQNANVLRNPIDAFVQRSLEDVNLTLSPAAASLELMRRAYFDLTGLPPSELEVRQYMERAEEDADEAYQQLIDQLLNSPRYGERWARYWLDVAGYADSEGVQHSDAVRANAWRYRDYVIRSFNGDKPYDRFIIEQIAGDELADFRDHDAVTPEIYDNLVATGFLRMAPDGTWANITNFVPDRLDVIDDEIEILSSSVMGLTFKCARCHSHKFDPISHRNYYGLLAIFKGALDEHDWLKPYGATQFSSGPFGRRQLPFVATTERRAWQANNEAIDKRVEELKAELEQLKAAAETDEDKKKAEEQRKTAENSIQEEIKKQESQRRPEPLVRALWDRGSPSPTFLLRRGNYLTPGELVPPHVPASVKAPLPFQLEAPPRADSTGRRLSFAKWLAQPEHPLTSRVIVNRIWKHHFGQGIVRTIDNFGKSGDTPSHPELLDWLAVRFVADGWRIKELHRLIMLSSTYRQTSGVSKDREQFDPENRLLSRMPLRRLDAEALRDTLLHVSGKLNLDPFGPPDSVSARGDGLVTSVGSAKGWRRSIFVQQRRTQIPTILENFDLPRMGPNCVDRTESTVAHQALHLLNNKMVHELSLHFANRVAGEKDAQASLSQSLSRIYLVALSRPPTDDELSLAVQAVEQLEATWRSKTPASEHVQARSRALANYCHAIMNSAAFLYID